MINLQTVNSDFTFEVSSGRSPEYSGILDFRDVKIIPFTAGGSAKSSSAAVSPLTGLTRIEALAAVCVCVRDLSLSLFSLSRQAPAEALVLLRDSDS